MAAVAHGSINFVNKTPLDVQERLCCPEKLNGPFKDLGFRNLLMQRSLNNVILQDVCRRSLHITASCHKVQAGRYKITPKGDRPLTYEMANPPHFIAHRKSWNSWNTSNLEGGLRSAETAVEDIFIRRFMTGTWHSLFASEVIIKRQHNIIRVAGIVRRAISSRKMYFLIGYSEELLGSWLKCPVKLEIQTIADKKEVIFKYV